MSTLVGALIQAIGEKMETAFPDHSVIYGMPVPNGIRYATGYSVRIHFMQERGVYSGSQGGGVVVVSPVISVTVETAFASDATELATQQASLEVGAELRTAIEELVMDHLTGSATITAFAGQALWITDFTLTPALNDIGPGQSVEAQTAEFTFRFSRNYEGR